METQQREEYIQKLSVYKPWLSELIPNLKTSKFDYISKNFPITDEEIKDFENIKEDPEQRQQFQLELDFIQQEIVKKRY